MLEYNTMVARFNDEHILKAIIDLTNKNHVYIIYLDNDGEEQLLDAYLSFPTLEIKVINNSNSDISLFDVASINQYGITDEEIKVKAGETLTISTIFVTTDSTTYVYPINATESFTVTDEANCVFSDPYIVALDMDPEVVRSCTVTFS